jgi:hypothetical protein
MISITTECRGLLTNLNLNLKLKLMMTESKLTLTAACELTAIFNSMSYDALDMYAQDLGQRMNLCAISYIEGGPMVEQQTYLEMKDILSRVQSALDNKHINVM